MPQSLVWTKAQLTAWEYIESAITQGYKASQALESYRESGGKIRTQDYYIAWNRLKTSANEWTRLSYLSDGDTLPDKLFSPSPMKYANDFVVSFKANIVDAFTGQSKSVYRQIGFNTRLTVGEMYDTMDALMYDDKSSPASSINYITELHFFKRVGK